MIALPAELTHDHASACLQALAQGVRNEAGTQVVVDGASLARFDSSALAVLLDLRRQCKALDKQLCVTRLPKQLLDLAGLYGVAELLPGQ